MKEINKIKVLVERHEDGTYWGVTQNIPGVVTSYGDSLSDLKDSLQQAFKDYLEVAKAEDLSWATELEHIPQWEYKMNIQAFFDLIPELKISAIGKKAGINESLMRQYACGKAAVSEARMKLIEKAIHELAQELSAVSF